MSTCKAIRPVVTAVAMATIALTIAGCNDQQKTRSPNSPRPPAYAPASAPPTSALDLRTMIGRGTYTLQIGYYDAKFGKDFRQAAEKAAQVLRADGHQAFFYHGPFRSMVTVGVFGPNAVAVDKKTGLTTYSPEVQKVRTQFKYHMANGREILIVHPDGTKTPQITQLVCIPKPSLR